MPGGAIESHGFVLGRRTALVASIAALLALLCGAIAIARLREGLEAGDLARRSLEVREQASVVEALLVDAESGQRGFLLTGQESYLDPYRAAVDRFARELGRLDSLTAEDPKQHARVVALGPIATAKLRELAATLRTREQEGASAALAIVHTGEGRRTMESFRVAFAEITQGEAGRTNARLEERRRYALFAGLGIALLAASSVGALAVLLLSLNRSALRRIDAERRATAEGERFRVTLQSIGDAVIATDASGRVAFMNPVAARLTGFDDEAARGLPISDVFRIVNEWSRETVESPVDRVLRENAVVGLANHTVLIDRLGGERPIDDSGAPILDPDGSILGVVLVFRDVTERRSADAARERWIRSEAAREAAELASRAKDDFLATVSHELRSPLAAALGWTAVLKTESADGAVRDRALASIERNLRLQARLTSDLLDVSRMISGTFTLERQTVDVAELTRSVVLDWREAAERKGVAFRCDPTAAASADADPARLSQALANLLSNALKFTPADGSIDVTVSGDDTSVEIAVQDTGSGIRADLLPTLFERFHRSEGLPVGSQEGLGLGLAIARRIVELHGGEIALRSPGPGGGATALIRLPRVDVGSPYPSAAGIGNARELEGLAVLLVEDHVDTRDAIAHLLASRGATVTTAGSLAEAWPHLEARGHDLLLSDLGLPDDSGLALVRRLRALEESGRRRTPAIAVTGFGRTADVAGAAAAGFDAYVEKPVEFAELLTTVRRVRSSHAAR